MTDIKAPECYVNEFGVTGKVGEHIKKFGNRIMIIGGKTALRETQENITNSLLQNDVMYHIYEFTGYPTLEKANEYAEQARKKHIEVLVAVGGGKVCDVTKTAGDIAGIPVITIPTISATCASWAAVSVLYTEEGDFHRFYQNRYTPRLIIVDPEVLIQAPERYLKAGIIDTYAKWYELAPGLKGRQDTLVMQISSFGARLAFDILDDNAEKAIEAVRKKQVDEAFLQTIDAIIFLAGYVGTFVGARAYSGFAHPFYHSSRRISESRKMLHGELVSYGILAQLVMEGKSEESMEETIRKFDRLDVAFTLQDLGLDDDQGNKLPVIAERTLKEFGGFTKLGFGYTSDEICRALLKADEQVRTYRKNKSLEDGYERK